MPLFVLRMAVDGELTRLMKRRELLSDIAGPAAQDGRLQVGDQLIEINGQSTKNLTHGEAIELIKTGGGTVRLLVRRGRSPNPALLGNQVTVPDTSFYGSFQ